MPWKSFKQKIKKGKNKIREKKKCMYQITNNSFNHWKFTGIKEEEEKWSEIYIQQLVVG